MSVLLSLKEKVKLLCSGLQFLLCGKIIHNYRTALLVLRGLLIARCQNNYNNLFASIKLCEAPSEVKVFCELCKLFLCSPLCSVPTSIRRFGILPSPAVETAKSSGRKAKSVFWQGRTQDLQVPAKKMAFLKSKFCEVQIF